MSNYVQATFFTPKDSLITGDPLKLIKGSEVDPELAAISVAIATKIDTAGIGLEKVSTTFNITTAALAEVAVVDADRIMFQDVSDSDTMVVTTYADLITAIQVSANHDSLTGFVANEHIDHTGVTITAGVGLSYSAGGTDISASATIDLDINSLTGESAILSADTFAFYDVTATEERKITLTELAAALSLIVDHDTLVNFVANEHVDHTAVVITAGDALSYSVGGTDISASATVDLDISGLATQLVLDETADFFVFYDDSNSSHRKIPAENIAGTALGDGHWYRNGAFTATTEATLAYDTEEYDSLERGTFSTGTGQYTRGTDAGRIWVSAQVGVQAMDDDDSLEIEVQVNGVTKLRHYQWNDTENDTPELHISCQGALNLAASDIVRVRITASSSEAGTTGTQNSFISIQELS